MDQDTFIRKRSEDWKKLDSLILRIKKDHIRTLSYEDLRNLGVLYRRTCSDLSFATSFCFDRKLTEYLNGCVGRAYAELYRDEPFTLQQILAFFTRGFPEKVRIHFPFILAAFLIFTISTVVVFSQVYFQPELATYVVSESILESFQKGICEKHAGTSLTTEAKSTVSHQIMTNNIIVGINAFATGILYGIGTVYLLVINAALLGALASLSAQYNDSLIFWSLILPHGVFELPAIFICGGAGFLIAYAMINPGEHFRIDALKRNGREAASLMLGVIVLFVIAAITEGFLTPLPISPWLKLAFSGLVFVVLVYYFVRK